MREIFLIIATNSEGVLSARRMFGTREEVQAKMVEMIKEDAKNDQDGYDCGTEDVYELDYVGEGNGFHGFNNFKEYSIEYYAYPVNDIPMTNLSVTDKVMDAQTVVNTGIVQTDSFSLTEFDEDEGFWERTVPAGTYEFRILDVRGWRPHQILVDDKWIDIAGNEALIDSIQNQIKESGVEV